MIRYHLEPQYLCVIPHQKLSNSPVVLVYYTIHVTLRKIWIVNKEIHRGFIRKY